MVSKFVCFYQLEGHSASLIMPAGISCEISAVVPTAKIPGLVAAMLAFFLFFLLAWPDRR